ncbi:MAG: hypothetical protein MUW57_15365 [Pseudomonas sp.]|nr:hypothetical protein [Pseudomonas sp.]
MIVHLLTIAFIALSIHKAKRNFPQRMVYLAEKTHRMFKKYAACLTSGTLRLTRPVPHALPGRTPHLNGTIRGQGLSIQKAAELPE